MLILTFEEFNNKFNIDNNAMSDIRIKGIGKDISLTPTEVLMRENAPDNISDNNFNIIVNLHPTDGTHWVLVIRREDGSTYYFDSFGVETPPLFLEEYVDLGSYERIQQYDESYCGAYCLYMIYLIDSGFKIKSALNILVNQVKCPEKYNECFRLGCIVNDKYNVNGLRSSFANNDNDSVKDLRSSFANQGTDGLRGMPTCSADNDNDNVKDLRSSFADNIMYQFDEKHPKGKPNNEECPTNTISININEDLQSWRYDDNIITEATLPENFRCIISGPSECGKTFLLKKLILSSIYFDKLYIIGPTGDQYKGLERINPKADIEFVKDIKDLPSPDKLPKDLKKLMIFDDVRAKESAINEYFCRGRHNNCNMIYLNQNLFTIDRQSVRENCNLFILFEQIGRVLISIY